jgi:hypothetical protein
MMSTSLTAQLSDVTRGPLKGVDLRKAKEVRPNGPVACVP